MRRPTVALITGFVHHAELMRAALAPLAELKKDGAIDRIHYVTWDDPAIDECLKPLGDFPSIDLVRVKQPQTTGPEHVKGFCFQTANLEAALELVPERDALVIRTRPDFLFDKSFLASKILAADFLLAPNTICPRGKVPMPASPLEGKLWIPWADANQPFFFEDGTFIGRRQDVAAFVRQDAVSMIRRCGDVRSGWIAHVLRFIMPFLDDYPIFDRYLSEFELFVQDMDYRVGMLGLALEDVFYCHLLVAGAWILATNFHVDVGYQGQLRFYPNRHIKAHLHRPLADIPFYSPYSTSAGWRSSENPGRFFNCVHQAFGRLMDDAWQTTLFTASKLEDLSTDNITQFLFGISQHKLGYLDEIEAEFYAKLRDYYCRTEQAKNAA